jgi:tetratricopeptide (TPR) repeat protein
MGWSDGYASIWALNAIAALGKCPWCKALFWLDDAEQVGVLPRGPYRIGWIERAYLHLTGDKRGLLARERTWHTTPWEWKSAKDIELPTLADWQTALQERAALTPAREKLARRQIWWRSNDHLRFRRDGTPCEAQAVMAAGDEQENLERLLELREAEPKPDLVELGEILRELGRFEEALAVLERVDGKQREQALLIADFARGGDAVVREVWRSQYDY